MTSGGLAARVAALERAVAGIASQQAGGETRTPSYLTYTAAGLIGADFSGKISASELDLIGGPGASPIKWLTTGGGLLAELTVDASGNLILSPAGIFEAQGIEIPAGINNTPTAPNRYVWQRVGGPIVASLTTYEGVSNSDTVTEIISGGTSTSPGGGADPTASLNLRAVPSSAGTISDLTITSSNAPSSASIQGLVETPSASLPFTLMDGNGNSSFVQNAVGSIQLFLQGGASTISVTSAGWSGPYTVTFPTAFSSVTSATYSLIPQGATASINASEMQTISMTGFAVDINSALAQNVIVEWIAIGA